MSGAPTTFEAIVAPLGADQFLDEYLWKRPVHIEGPPDKWQAVMNWGVLNRILDMTSIWASHSLLIMLDKKPLPASSYCYTANGRDGDPVLRPDPVRVKALLSQGATLVLNDIDQLTPELSRFCRIMEETLGAKFQANLYLSSQRKQGFKVHFDTHDVFAVHVMGEKTWMVFEGRAQDPIAHALFKDLPAEHHETAKGKLWKEVRLKPGDLLYLPRGQYHYALADEGACAHIAVGATYPIGLDAITHLFERMVAEPAARANFPRGGRAELAARLAEIGERAKALLSDEATLNAMAAFQAGFRYPRETYNLPEDTEPKEKRYSLKVGGLKLVEHAGRVGLTREGTRQAVEIPAPLKSLMAWVLERKSFSRGEIGAAFPGESLATIESFLAEINRMGLVDIQG
jgi:ribosomal protein L16 Arg81 hydroxylase